VSICHKIFDQSKGEFLKKTFFFGFNNKANKRELENSDAAPL